MHLDYPKPTIPLSALLGFNVKTQTNPPAVPSVFDVKFSCMATSGRYAIALALEHAKLNIGDEVLIPAYHCEAMIAPVKWIGAIPKYYRINADTSINFDDITLKITANTKAIMVSHYFGFLQDLTEIRQLCNQHGIILIEDCAHALFGRHNGHSVGKIGDYAIASSMKFLPLYEGGLLCSETIDLSTIPLTAPNALFQLKSLINILEKSIAYGKLGKLGTFLNSLLKLKNSVWNKLKNRNTAKPTLVMAPSSSEGGSDLDASWVHKTISLPSKLIIKFSKLNNVAQRRRDNYLKLHAALANLPNSRPLFKTLPKDVVPWVYPLYVNKPEAYFHRLKTQGIPIWRFGEFLAPEVDYNLCAISMEYSRHIFQFPCHQSLTESELDWMITRITKTLTAA